MVYGIGRPTCMTKRMNSGGSGERCTSCPSAEAAASAGKASLAAKHALSAAISARKGTPLLERRNGVQWSSRQYLWELETHRDVPQSMMLYCRKCVALMPAENCSTRQARGPVVSTDGQTGRHDMPPNSSWTGCPA